MFESHITLDEIVSLASGFKHASICLISYADENQAEAQLDNRDTIGETMEDMAWPSVRAACSLSNLPAILSKIQAEIEREARIDLSEIDDTAGERFTVEWLNEGWEMTTDFDRCWAANRIRFRLTGTENLAGVLMIQVQSIVQSL